MSLCLFLNFNSFIQPLIIFISIPLALFGSFFRPFLFRQPLLFTVVLGIISLCGIVINNAIILTDFINREIREGNQLGKQLLTR
ncbi:efflux RND transporter permease subunit [Anaerobacillus sp. HL2]|nr:efflux RND transporter permease subunit [Anaerobacillus sp. HL2]